MTAVQVPPLRTFISFADRKGDRQFVSLLLARLNDQPLHVWNYHGEREEIPGGTDIGERLRQEIDTCQAFLPIISASTFQSEWVAQEVVYALGRHKNGQIKIVPVESSTLHPHEAWPEPFTALKKMKSRKAADFTSLNVEELVQDLCRDLSVSYRPLLPEHYRFPYRLRFLKEIYQAYETEMARPRRTDRERAIFEDLLRLLGQFGAAIADSRHLDALRVMQIFCLKCEHDYVNLRLYYPYVARGTCELLTGRLPDAEKTFRELLAREEAEESTFGALGHICLRQENYQEALEHFRRARSLRPTDAAAMFGEIIASIRLKIDLDLEAAFRVLDDDRSVDGNHVDRIQEVKALALKNAGRLGQAVDLYADLNRRGVLSPDATLEFADLLRSLGMLEDALEVLRPLVDGQQIQIVMEAARLAAFCQSFAESEILWRMLLARDPQNRRCRLEFARFYWDLDMPDEARKVLAPLMESSPDRLPSTAEDFYCEGAAQWVCGDRTLAEYDFRRSGFAERMHYRHMLPK